MKAPIEGLFKSDIQDWFIVTSKGNVVPVNFWRCFYHEFGQKALQAHMDQVKLGIRQPGRIGVSLDDIDIRGCVAAGNRGILGPGTGLGVSGLVRAGQDWAVVAGEGGHVTLAATTAEEAQIIAQVTHEHGHCSAERLVSGPGLVTLYELNGGEHCAPEAITRLAQEGDALALQTLELFSQLLGTVAADLALTLGARGGIYLGGGILPDIANLFAAGGFRERFEAKGRFTDYLADMPTYIICTPHPSFRGLFAYMRRLGV